MSVVLGSGSNGSDGGGGVPIGISSFGTDNNSISCRDSVGGD